MLAGGAALAAAGGRIFALDCSDQSVVGRSDAPAASARLRSTSAGELGPQRCMRRLCRAGRGDAQQQGGDRHEDEHPRTESSSSRGRGSGELRPSLHSVRLLRATDTVLVSFRRGAGCRLPVRRRVLGRCGGYQRSDQHVERRGTFLLAEDQRFDAGAVGGGADGGRDPGVADALGGL